MIAELGQFALALALAACLAQASFLLVGAGRGRAAWLAAGQQAAVAHGLLLAAAFAALVAAFLGDDFATKVVAANSHSALPVAYRLAATWAGHEGSMLLWALALGAWTVALRCAWSRLPQELAGRALGVLGLVSAAFLAVVIATANPFARGGAAPPEGRDLNPLLQDPGMLFHAPLLAFGGAGLGVAFSLAIAALLAGRFDAAWARGSRPWSLASWSLLTLGLGLGARWAYREPAWGGWWSWDPVETGALLPWLAATALLHSLATTDKRGLHRRWTAFLAVLAFVLALAGLFLARSGLPPSARAAAADPSGAAGLLALVALVAGAAGALFARRARTPDGRGSYEMVSRDAALDANNAVLLSALGAVLLGACYPIVAGAAGQGPASVGPRYFESVFVTLMLPGLALMGPGSRMRWGSQAPAEALRDAIRPAWVALATVAIVVLATPTPGAWGMTGLFLATWIAWHTLEALAFRWRQNALRAQPSRFYAMHAAHLGVAAFIAGLALSNSGALESEVVLFPGAAVAVGSVRLQADGAREVAGPNYRALRLRLRVVEAGHETVLEPETRVYRAGGMQTSEAAVDGGWRRDVWVSVAQPSLGGPWTVRVRVRPFQWLLWLGFALLVLGGTAATLARRPRASVTLPDGAEVALFHRAGKVAS